MSIILIIAACLVVVFLIRFMATKDHVFGKICRWFWNTSCVVTSCIPFLSWVIKLPLMGPVKNHELAVWVDNMATDTSKIAGDIVDEAGRKQIEERNREEAIRNEIAKRGGENASISSDGSTASYTKNGIEYKVNVTYK